MTRLLQYICRSILPTNIRKSIDIFPYLRNWKIEGLKEKSVLVLAPHPDDDIIGCGGTLYTYHLKGADITAIYMTDGRKGNHLYAEEELVSVRKEETKRAAKIVGIDKLIFSDNRDSELAVTGNTIKQVHEVLGDSQPEAVFFPFVMDNHQDHIATARIFFSAARVMKYDPLCYMYGIWTPLPAYNVVSDITLCLETKLRALKEHKSQLELANLTDAVKGLSNYYSILNGGNGYAEPFIACPLHEYRRLGKVIGW